MKAVFITQHGGPEVLQYGDLPDPQPGPGEVLVRVRAAALNRLDTYTRAGVRGMKREFPQPLVLGGDAAGDVAAVGPGVAAPKPGDRVVVNPRLTCRVCSACQAGEDDLCDRSRMLGSHLNGSYAEYVVVPAINTFPIAGEVSYEAAAAVPTTFLPVWNMLVRKAKLRPWETVLVLSASAGVGAAALQVAKGVIGARVIATTSTPEKAARAREVGADEVILYPQEDIAQRVKELTDGQGVDVVVDHTGQEHFEAALASLRKGGRFCTCGVTTGYRAQLHMGLLFTRQLHVLGVYMGTQEDMRQIVAMLGRGRIAPVVDRVLPLSEARQAHELMESRAFFGKVLLRP